MKPDDAFEDGDRKCVALIGGFRSTFEAQGAFFRNRVPDQRGAGPVVRCFGPSGHRGTRLRAEERDRLDESALMWGILVFWRASQEQSELN